MSIVLLFFLMPLRATAIAAPFTVTPPCDSKLHAKRAKELQSLESADQADRVGDINKIDWKQVGRRDLERRQKATAIFSEGDCFMSADDFFNAALVFQHGSVPDHVFQAYVWAKRAAELNPGHPHANLLSQAALDRYLMDFDYKQVYATQASKDPAGCFCLWPVEDSMTDELRQKAGGKTIAEKMEWVAQLNKNDPKCKPAFCPVDAKPAIKGAVAGLSW